MNRRLRIATKSWPLKEAFVISRATQTTADVIVVELEHDAHVGRGEAVGVDYHGETPATMCRQVESVRQDIEGGIGRQELLSRLPPGGARNAIDAALWDLEAKVTGMPVWHRAAVAPAKPVATTVTIGIRPIDAYESSARGLADHPWLKIKVSGERPIEAIAAVRRGAPHARLVVDANQAWDIALMDSLARDLVALHVDLLEQPVHADDDAGLAGLRYPIPVCADEAADTLDDLPRLVGRYDFVNIKLDKTGGLTAALDFAHAARAAGLRLMVGCMVGGSIAMAPAMVLAQLCEVADLDGPLLQAEDWPDGIKYTRGIMSVPPASFWG